MKRAPALLLPALLALAPAGVAAQSLYKCTGADGRVTYQETPCVGERAQKRLDGGQADRDAAEARRQLEREAFRGNELAGGFARDAREREAARWREREARAREEHRRRMLEEELRPAEDVPWNPPWGFPAKPGQARPPAKPKG
ncbi:MAG: DUF4124 domain-containing protein [Burkholderiales bacterium]|nr:DUF4124 domain-containing protein [Burkholderiales bacterium]